MESLRNFIIGLAVSVGLPWFFLIVRPYTQELARQPVLYTEADVEYYENSELKGYYFPKQIVGDRKRGELVYANLGCAQCHTQVIRPSYAGSDEFKKGYGSLPDKITETRQTSPWDYLHEDIAMIGMRRLGPDLTNYGRRAATSATALNDIYVMLYNPRAIHTWSTMSAYPSLFDEVPIEAGSRPDALKFPSGTHVREGYQIVPSGDAKALAEYLLTLKRDLPLPISLTGHTLDEKKALTKK